MRRGEPVRLRVPTACFAQPTKSSSSSSSLNCRLLQVRLHVLCQQGGVFQAPQQVPRPSVNVTLSDCVLLQVVVEAHFLMRAATHPETGALQVSAVQLSLVLADLSMPTAGPLVVDTAFSVTWANATVPEAALQVSLAVALYGWTLDLMMRPCSCMHLCRQLTGCVLGLLTLTALPLSAPAPCCSL